MAKYTGSPFGTIRGKVSGSVGQVWKGIKYLREHTYPRQGGTITKFDAIERGCVRGIGFKVRQFNYQRCVLGVLGYMASQNLPNLIRPVWQELCDKLKYKITGTGLFIKKNARALWETFPNRDAEFSYTNFPDMTHLQVSDGLLEPTQSIAASLAFCAMPAGVNYVTINWNTNTFRNGKSDDIAWLAVYKHPSVEEFIRRVPRGILYTRNTGRPRSAGTGSIRIPCHSAGELTAFVFFSDACANYSPSVSSTVTQT